MKAIKVTIILFLLGVLSWKAYGRRRRSHCKDDALEKREQIANIVFTGTVEKLYRARTDVYRGRIRVKRVLKGDESLVDNTVIVDGFGDPQICYSDVKERDTRIFLVKEVSKNNLRLNSSVIRVSVNNIDRAVSAVKGLPAKKRKPTQESHCEKMYCAYGAQCLVDQRTQQAHCRCQETCYSDVFAPVCGSDGITYSSECQLRMASCTRQKRIFTKHQGPCGLKNPCDEKKCLFGAECQPSLDGRSAECICPEKCATFGDRKNSRPVCGTDGKDYPNVCELRRTSCIEMRDIDIRYKAKCDPCDDMICPPHQVCQLDENRTPECRCNDICIPEYRPICGSDGKTYINECHMRVEACKTQKQLRVIYSGSCTSGTNPCDMIKCGAAQECDIDKYGVASCQCPKTCEPKIRPVCGSNGRTFDNECEMKRQSCLLRQELVMVYEGECGGRRICLNHHCSYGAICVVKNGQPICECSTCAEEFEPVCGTDNISYTNVCKLKREACEQKADIAIAQRGLCNGCDAQQCDFYALCESDGEGGKACVCPQVCVKVEAPVCGSDGVSYQNECELRVEACKKQKYIAVATKGYCDQCIDVHCKYGARCENGRCVCPTHCPDIFEHVCSSDGKTYQNECEMRRVACQKSEELSVHFFGICDAALEVEETPVRKEEKATSCHEKDCKFGGTCDFNGGGILHCKCNFPCPSIREPVCGIDGKIYENECRLREESCLQQRRIVEAPREVCAAHMDIPCEGEQPVINPSTGKQYYCGRDVGGTLCPVRTYCHMTQHFATCCKDNPLVKSCVDTPFGCCPDGRTPVLGPNSGGCPSVCNCNRLGSYSFTCDPVTKQCPCKPGVSGLRCDRCEPGYWGLHKISNGNSGCANCRCNPFGSVRDDCDQMTGRCVCKHGIHGMKCDFCPDNAVLGPNGCIDESSVNDTLSSCDDVQCYHGAVCKIVANKTHCSCDFQCPPEGAKDPVCGTDAHTYGSECQLRMFSCRYQKTLSVKFYGTCKSRSQEGTNSHASSTKLPRRFSRRRSQVKRPDSKVTREVTTNYAENLFLTTKAPPTTQLTTTVAITEHFLSLVADEMEPIEEPMFLGDSYLELHRLDAYSRLSVEMEFKAYHENAILLYNGQSVTGHGDFVSLTLKDGFLEFRYNLGSGSVIIRSSQKVPLGQFIRVTIKRYLRDGMLSVEGQDNVSGRSQGLLNSLNLAQNLFIGAIPSNSKTNFANAGVSDGLVGCIRRLKIDRKEVNLKYPHSKAIINAVKIRECSENACSRFPCKNNGICAITEEDDYKCTCVGGFSGRNCEKDVSHCYSNPCAEGATCIHSQYGGYACKCPPGKTGRHCDKGSLELSKVNIPDFSTNSYLEMNTLQNVRQAFSLEIWFLTRSLDGSLLYNGQLLNGKGDFVSINLVNGYVQCMYDLGSGVGNITSRNPVSLNEWHSVKVSRLRRQGTLKLNNETAILGKSKPPLTELNLSLPLYIGGVPNLKYIHRESGVKKGLDGAIQRVIINGDVWDHLTDKAVRSVEVRRYKGHPCIAGSCKHGGVCLPELNNYKCSCSPKYKGKQCERKIRVKDMQRAISFNGTHPIAIPYKNSKGSRSRKSNRFHFRFRTNQANGLLLWANRGHSLKSDYLAVAIIDGYPQLSFNLGKQTEHCTIRSRDKVDDGLWHSVTVHRKKRFGEIRVDRGITISNISEAGATDLNINDQLWIGGCPALPSGLPTGYYQSFDGCIDSILIDKIPFSVFLQETRSLTFCDDKNAW